MKIVILDGHAVNRGDLSWDALRGLGELEVFDRTAEKEIVNRASAADALFNRQDAPFVTNADAAQATALRRCDVHRLR
jgi:hypothetical protein